MPASVIVLFCLAAALTALFIGFRVALTRSREGKMLAFIALFALPIMAAWTASPSKWTAPNPLSSASPVT